MPLGMPTYQASGGHYFGQTRYRFLILPRYDFDLHSIIRSRQVETKNILIIASQLIDILEHIHDCGYAHSDIKAENIMIGECTYKRNKNDRTHAKASNAASQKAGNCVVKRKPVRKLRMTMTQNASDSRQSKRSAKSKSYAESSGSSSCHNHKSEDSDFSEDFGKLSDDDDEEDDDEIDDDIEENAGNGDDMDDSGN